MNKSQIKYYIILILGIITFVLIEQNYDEKIDWTQSFSKQDKIPYGGYVLYKQLDKLFPNTEIIVNKKSFYEFYKSDYKNTNYIIINNDLSLSKLAVDKFLEYVNNGNNLFIASASLPIKLLDTLNISLSSSWSFMNNDSLNIIKLVNPKLRKNKNYIFNNNLYTNVFDTISKTTTIIGLNNKNKPNFIKQKIGNGNIFINLQPLAFTNYNMLYSDKEYINNSLSYLPNQKTFWDEYYKGYNYENMSPLRYILTVPAFKFAYYLLIFSLLFYIIFQAKRRQKAIPIVNPPQNTSKEFIETIGRLNFLQKDNKSIIEKKTLFLLENIRKKHFIKTNNIDKNFIRELSIKSEKNKEFLSDLFNLINVLQEKEIITDNELKKFNNFVEKFYE